MCKLLSSTAGIFLTLLSSLTWATTQYPNLFFCFHYGILLSFLYTLDKAMFLKHKSIMSFCQFLLKTSHSLPLYLCALTHFSLLPHHPHLTHNLCTPSTLDIHFLKSTMFPSSIGPFPTYIITVSSSNLQHLLVPQISSKEGHALLPRTGFHNTIDFSAIGILQLFV